MNISKSLLSDTEKQLAIIDEQLSGNRAEKKQLLRLAKSLKLSLRLMGDGGDPPAKKKTKMRRRSSKKHSAPTPTAS